MEKLVRFSDLLEGMSSPKKKNETRNKGDFFKKGTFPKYFKKSYDDIKEDKKEISKSKKNKKKPISFRDYLDEGDNLS